MLELVLGAVLEASWSDLGMFFWMPRWRQDGGNTTQDGAKTAQNGAKMRPRRHNMSPRCAQNGTRAVNRAMLKQVGFRRAWEREGIEKNRKKKKR